MRLSVKDVLLTLLHSIWIIIVASVLGAAIFFTGTYFFVDPEYTATAKLYVYIEKTEGNYISSSDLSVSKQLVDTYLIIVESDPVLETVAEKLNSKYPSLTAKNIETMVYGNSLNETEAFYVSATSTDRQLATDVINTILEVVPNEIIRVVKAGAVELIEPAQLPAEKDYSWPIVTYSIIGFLLGFALSSAYILVCNAMDGTIYGRKEVISEFNLPILGAIPEQTDSADRKNLKKAHQTTELSQKYIINKKTSFPVSEAYRKARTSIFYLPFESNCRKIVVTSAVSGEGKSTTAINIAIMLAQADKKVLLIDADMRRPKISKYMGLSKHDGLSEFLAGLSSSLSIVKDEETKVDIVCSGQATSSAAELLASPRTNILFKQIEELGYDFVIIDSPPVNVVTDSTVMADKVDGYLFVLRAGYSNIYETKAAISALEQIDAKILGTIISNIDFKVEQYGRYNRYGRYYNRYSKYYSYGRYGKYGYGRYSKYGYSRYGKYGNYRYSYHEAKDYTSTESE